MDPSKLIFIAVLALFLVGPEKLPDYAARLGRFVRAARGMLDDAKDRVREELGPDFDEEEWRKLDPRQYDPRRIIRDALLEPPEPRRRETEPEADPLDDEPEPEPVVQRARRRTNLTAFDDEAT
ncbi:Sec-independent protein translocase TatB [Amnibacterium kyonggiense]|uniref:Sec-independent protein translocase protein TatB n=1 Tax=Amnibacterium kyonggiense TaxID=595671 RepID=A0A4R7FJ47_9MICO|nr:Sec-independent protein translocase TatB [Amnibacterium kyonggiense]TDS75982.1 sec-independent protein translocase protein TatB [Amnibacterium kyonggiense]